MPKNQNGDVKCINEGTSINGGSSVHKMEKVEGDGVIIKGVQDVQGKGTFQNQGMPIKIHKCQTCNYVEMYFNSPF